MISAKKMAIGFIGMMVIGAVGVMVFSPTPVVNPTANIGGVQIESLRDPLSLGSELQGALFAEEVLPLHQPALPFGFEFEGTVKQGLLEEGSAERLVEILAGESITGEILRMEDSPALLPEPKTDLETDSTALGTMTESMAVTQAEKEIFAEHRYFGSCNGY